MTEQLGREYTQLSRAHLKKELLDKLSEIHSFELPEGIVDSEFEGIWKQVLDAKERDTLDADDKEKSEDELKANYREIAERRVRLGLLLADVGRVNNISVTQEDLNRGNSHRSLAVPGQEARVIEYFQKDANALQELQAPILKIKSSILSLNWRKLTNRKSR